MTTQQADLCQTLRNLLELLEALDAENYLVEKDRAVIKALIRNTVYSLEVLGENSNV